MLTRRLSLQLLILTLSTVFAQAQVTPEPVTLVPGKPAEREIAGGQSHIYQITLQAGQYARVVAEQKAIGVTLLLAAPDGKQVLEVNLTPAGGLESLSAEATASGDYRLTVRGGGSAAIAGSYQVRLEVKAAATGSALPPSDGCSKPTSCEGWAGRQQSRRLTSCNRPFPCGANWAINTGPPGLCPASELPITA